MERKLHLKQIFLGFFSQHNKWVDFTFVATATTHHFNCSLQFLTIVTASALRTKNKDAKIQIQNKSPLLRNLK